MCNIIRFIFSKRNFFFEYLFLFCFLKQINTKPIRRRNHDECDKFYNITDCYYFPCLDAHYSCGRDNHLARFSYNLCILTTNKYSSQLTLNAKYYFNHTNQCAMQSLHNQLTEKYISEKFTCGHLQLFIFNIYLDCFQVKQHENKMIEIIDFCSILCENLQTMIDLFLNINTQYINLYQLLIETGRSCGADINNDIVHTIPSLLMSICLDRKNVRLKQDITNVMFNTRFEPTDYEWI